MDAHLRALFAEEAETLLTRIAADALELESRRDDPELLASMFRSAHTLKGSAGLMGFTEVTDAAHALEDRLGRVRDGEVAAGPAVVDEILTAVDGLRRRIAELLDADAAPATAEPSAPSPAPVPAPPPPPQQIPAPALAPAHDDEAISVSLGCLDRLVRLAGESRTARLRVADALGPALADPDVEAALADLDRVLAALQRETLGARMVRLAAIAEPLRRAVRDVARARGRTVRYTLGGERIELDRGVLDTLRDPLLHIVRNAVDHGIEDPEERAAAGKPAAGSLVIDAVRRGGELHITVADDGRGLDPGHIRRALPDAGAGLSDAEVLDRIFDPGVTTAEQLTEVSGRGVGLDVVRTALASVRGRVEVGSEPGRGTTFSLIVPVTLAVLRCLLVRVAGERYAIPAQSVGTVAGAEAEAVGVEGRAALRVGEQVVPVADLSAVVGTPGRPRASGPAVVLAGAAGPRAVRVDELLGQRDVTLQDLGAGIGPLPLVAGATLDGDGRVVVVLDAAAVADRVEHAPAAAPPEAGDAFPRPPEAATILVVDDALIVRELQRSILERAGYAVVTAEDGAAALARIAEQPPDLVLTDIEMPGMDGFELVETIRRTPAVASLPVVIVTSRTDAENRRRGLEAGADAYLVKQSFESHTLVEAVGRILGEGAGP